MKKLLIIGCGGVGGSIANNLQEFVGDQYTLEGFLDDDRQKAGREFFGHRVIGGIDRLREYSSEVAVAICVAKPATRRSIVERLRSYPNVTFPSLISKHVYISHNVTIGEGVIIYAGAAIDYNTSIADFSIINMNCSIGHDCTISRCATLAPGVSLAGFSYIAECAEMCINSATVQGTRVGENSIVGGMGMVTCDIPANCTAVGVPAKPIKYHSGYIAMKNAG